MFRALSHLFPCSSVKGRQEPVICGDEEAGSLGGLESQRLKFLLGSVCHHSSGLGLLTGRSSKQESGGGEQNRIVSPFL